MRIAARVGPLLSPRLAKIAFLLAFLTSDTYPDTGSHTSKTLLLLPSARTRAARGEDLQVVTRHDSGHIRIIFPSRHFHRATSDPLRHNLAGRSGCSVTTCGCASAVPVGIRSAPGDVEGAKRYIASHPEGAPTMKRIESCPSIVDSVSFFNSDGALRRSPAQACATGRSHGASVRRAARGHHPRGSVR